MLKKNNWLLLALCSIGLLSLLMLQSVIVASPPPQSRRTPMPTPTPRSVGKVIFESNVNKGVFIQIPFRGGVALDYSNTRELPYSIYTAVIQCLGYQTQTIEFEVNEPKQIVQVILERDERWQRIPVTIPEQSRQFVFVTSHILHFVGTALFIDIHTGAVLAPDAFQVPETTLQTLNPYAPVPLGYASPLHSYRLSSDKRYILIKRRASNTASNAELVLVDLQTVETPARREIIIPYFIERMDYLMWSEDSRHFVWWGFFYNRDPQYVDEAAGLVLASFDDNLESIHFKLLYPVLKDRYSSLYMATPIAATANMHKMLIKVDLGSPQHRWYYIVLDTQTLEMRQLRDDRVSTGVWTDENTLIFFSESGLVSYDFRSDAYKIIASNHTLNAGTSAYLTPDASMLVAYSEVEGNLLTFDLRGMLGK